MIIKSFRKFREQDLVFNALHGGKGEDGKFNNGWIITMLNILVLVQHHQPSVWIRLGVKILLEL